MSVCAIHRLFQQIVPDINHSLLHIGLSLATDVIFVCCSQELEESFRTCQAVSVSEAHNRWTVSLSYTRSLQVV